MTNETPLRSVLYTPGTKESVLIKALSSAADVLIFDLEDAVAPEAKSEARATVAKVVSDAGVQRHLVVRVNALNTAWCEDDVRAIAPLGVAGILFPKISTEAEVRAAEDLLNKYAAPAATRLWCMIETPLAILNVQTIAQQALQPGSRMSTWVIGTNDLIKELRAVQTASREYLLPALSMALLAARAYGLSILDGVHNDIRDMEGFESGCRQSLAMGFDGRTLIHPSQIEISNQVFSPTEEEIRQARTIVHAFDAPENKGKGVLKIDGRMVELLHAEIARRTLNIAKAIAHI